MRIVFAAACLLAAGLSLWGLPEEDDYKNWMKAAGANSGALRKSIEAKDGKAAEAAATKLHEVFSQVEAFWKKRGAADAIAFSKDAGAGFHSAGELAAAGKFEEAAAAAKKASATCMGCHTAHREKAEGGWKIK
jgi:hypothetical protein